MREWFNEIMIEWDNDLVREPCNERMIPWEKQLMREWFNEKWFSERTSVSRRERFYERTVECENDVMS